MFSSFVFSYLPVPKIVVSPKSLLASKLAGALAVYFEVDPQAIESNLLVDAKVVLHNIALKPQKVFPLTKLEPNQANEEDEGEFGCGEGGDGDGAAWLVGIIEEVVFSWKWGGSADGSTSFIREAVLTINGAKLRVLIGGEDTVESELPSQQTVSSSSSSPPPSPSEAAPGYLDLYVQQIIDHLTLNITNVEISVDKQGAERESTTTLGGDKVVIEVAAIQLATMGRQSSTSDHDSSSTGTSDGSGLQDESAPPLPPLAQRLSVESLSAYILLCDTNTATSSSTSQNDLDPPKIPLLDPISYATLVHRVSGRRFLNFVTGLEIIGNLCCCNINNNNNNHNDKTSSSSRVEIHAGRTQVKVLSELGRDLLRLRQDKSSNNNDFHDGDSIRSKKYPPGWTLVNALAEANDTVTVTTISTATEVMQQSDYGEYCDVQEEVEEEEDEEEDHATSSSTLLVLPLPSLILHLPNATAVQMPNCELRCRVDGSTFALYGTEGISIFHTSNNHDDDDIGNKKEEKKKRQLLELVGNASWSFDFVESSFNVSKRFATTTSTTQTAAAAATTTTTGEEDVIAHLHWEEKTVKDVVKGLREMGSISRDAIERVLEVCGGSDGTFTTAPASAHWSLSVEGTVILQLSGEGQDLGEEEWVQASIASPSIVLAEAVQASSSSKGSSSNDHGSSMLLHKLEMTSARIGPTSFGDLIVSIPSAALDVASSETQVWRFAGNIEATVQSPSVLEKLQKFVARIIDFGPPNPSSSDGDAEQEPPNALALPVAIKIPGVVISLEEPKHFNAQVDDILLNRDGSVHMNSTRWYSNENLAGNVDNSTFSGLVHGIAVQKQATDDILEVRVDHIDALHFPGVFELTNPVTKASIRFGNGLFDVHLSSIRMSLLHPLGTACTKNQNREDAGQDPSSSMRSTKSSIVSGFQLPFRVRSRVEELSIVLPACDQAKASPVVSVKAIGIEAISQTDGHLALKSHWAMACQIQGSDNQRLCLRVEPFSALLTSAFDIVLLKSLGMHIGPVSFGNLDVCLPAFTLESSQVRFDGCIKITMDHSRTAETTLKLVEEIQSKRSSSGASAALSFTVMAQKVVFALSNPMVEVSCTDVHLMGRKARLGTVQFTGPAETTGLCHGIRCNFEEITQVQVELIQSLQCPRMLSLAAPILQTKVVLNKKTIHVKVPTCSFIVNTPKASSDGASTLIGEMASLIGLATFDLSAESLVLQAAEDPGVIVSIYPIHVVASSADKNVSVQLSETVNVRLSTEPDHWFDARVGAGSATVVSEQSEIQSLTCSAIHIGPSSYGNISLDLPSVSLSTAFDGASLICTGVLSGVIQSVEVASLIKEVLQVHQSLFLPPMTSLQSNNRSTSMQLSALDIELEDLSARLQASGIMYTNGSGELRCANGNYLGSDATLISVKGILGCAGNSWTARAEFVDSLYFPGSLSLLKPITDVTFALSDESELFIGTESVSLLLLESSPEIRSSEETKLALPFPVTCHVTDLHLCAIENADDFFHAEGISIVLKPRDGAPLLVSPIAVAFCVKLERLDSMMAKVCGVCCTGLYCGKNIISDLKVRVKSAELTLGFSSIEWNRLLKKGRDDGEEMVWMLPDSLMYPFTANTVYRGKVLSTQTTLRFSQFSGGPATTSSNIVQHLKSEALQQMPSFFTQAEIMGVNVVNLSAQGVGSVVLGSAVKTSIVGSVGGIVVTDSIRGAIAHGKQARGVSVNESYKFGDVTRGSIRAIKETTKSTMQREGRDSYKFGDFTKGAVRGSAEYVKDNKSRLGGAAGSGAGMVVGSVLLGPVGLVAGCILGGVAGAKALADGGNPKSTVTSKDGPQRPETLSDTDLNKLNSAAGEAQLPVDASFGQSLSIDQPFQSLGTSETSEDLFASALQHGTLHSGLLSSQDQSARSLQYQQRHQLSVRGNPVKPIAHAPAPLELQTANNPLKGNQLLERSFDIIGSNVRSSAPNNSTEHDLLGFGSSSEACGHSTETSAWQRSAVSVSAQQSQFHQPTSVQSPGRLDHQERQAPSQPLLLKPPLPKEHPPQQKFAQHHTTKTRVLPQQSSLPLPPPIPQKQVEEKVGYRFGDLTRSVIAKGKQKRGQTENDSYQFGDFTRGLFGK